MPDPLRRTLWSAVLWSLGLVALAVVAFRLSIDPVATADLVARARIGPLLASVLCMSGGMLFMGFRWKALLPGGHRTSGWVLAGIDCTGQLFNVALPGPVGELVAAVIVERRYGIGAPLALAASLHGRVVGLAVAATGAVAVHLLFPIPIPGGAAPFVTAACLVVTAGAIGLVVVTRWPQIVAVWSDILLAPLARRPWPRFARQAARLDRSVRSFSQALVVLGRSFGFGHLRAAAWAVLGIVSVSVGDWLATLALGHPGSMAGLVFTHCTITAGAVLLFALPFGQLGWDAAFVALLQVATGLPLPVAIAVTAIVRLQMCMVLAFGAFFLPYVARMRSDDTGLVRQEAGIRPVRPGL